MTDLKEAFGELLDEPAPPMRPTEELLAAAGRAERRRRTGFTAAGAALAVAAVTGAALAFAAGLEGTRVPAGSQSQTTAPAIPTDPVHDASDLLNALSEALPAGFTTGTSSPAGVTYRSNAYGVSLLSGGLVVYGSDGAGELWAELEDGRSADDVRVRDRYPTGDLCAEQIPGSPREDSCRTVMVGSIPIRLSSGSANPGAHPNVTCEYATRFVPGARIVITQCPALVTLTPTEKPAGGLGRQIFTSEELATLAAAPAFLG